MKRPVWDACPPNMGAQSPVEGAPTGNPDNLQPGMRVTAFYRGHRVEVSLERPLDGELEFEGRVMDVFTEDHEVVGEIGVGDRVVIPMTHMCIIDKPSPGVQYGAD